MPMIARKNNTYLTLSLFGSDWILWLTNITRSSMCDPEILSTLQTCSNVHVNRMLQVSVNMVLADKRETITIY